MKKFFLSCFVLINLLSVAQTTVYKPAGLFKPGTLSPKSNPNNNNQQQPPVSNNSLGSLLDGGSAKQTLTSQVEANSYQLVPLTTNTTTKAVTPIQNNQPLTPLTYNTPKEQITNVVNQNLPPLSPLPTISNNKLQGMKADGMQQSSMPVLSSNQTNYPNNGGYKMPELGGVDNSYNSRGNDRFAMPPLESLDGNYPNAYSQAKTNNNQGQIPELAPIGQDENQQNNGEPMPKLAPIKGENGGAAIVENKDGSILIKSITLPHGTELKGTTKQAILVKPNVVIKPQENYKPGIGGGFGIDLVDDEQVVYQPQQNVVYQQPQQNYNTVTTTTTTTMPCNHVHTNGVCPCCVKKPVARKWKPKPKPKVIYQPVYVYQQAPEPIIVQPQPTNQRVQERVIYVPMNQINSQPQQIITQKPAEQPTQRIVYTDYTKVYYKEPEKPANNCNCPAPQQYQTVQQYNQQNSQPTNNQNRQQGNQNQGNIGNIQGANNPQKYYAPANYQGVSAGPTSGDYPANFSTSDEPFQYQFFVNKKGQYSVKLYNNNSNFLLSQNGQLISFEPTTDPTTGKAIKLNYFGKPEKVGGTQIAYNYNRTVHKIGNVKLEYDFEGFFKSVNGSNVFYNNRSKLDRVDNIKILYDQTGRVSGVDANDGKVQVSEE